MNSTPSAFTIMPLATRSSDPSKLDSCRDMSNHQKILPISFDMEVASCESD